MQGVGAAVDMVLAREVSGTVGWYLPDRLGTIRDIANNSGAIVDHVNYGAFGGQLSESSPANGDRLTGFAGMERDTATGLNLAVYRVQDPGTGRWTSEDPLSLGGMDANLYRYVRNSPTYSMDPTGLQGIPPKLQNPIEIKPHLNPEDGTVSVDATPTDQKPANGGGEGGGARKGGGGGGLFGGGQDPGNLRQPNRSPVNTLPSGSFDPSHPLPGIHVMPAGKGRAPRPNGSWTFHEDQFPPNHMVGYSYYRRPSDGKWFLICYTPGGITPGRSSRRGSQPLGGGWSTGMPSPPHGINPPGVDAW
jgi:RHS repeat-associated protein